jgi:hypothetical protein
VRVVEPGGACQTARKGDPVSARKRDPPLRDVPLMQP